MRCLDKWRLAARVLNGFDDVALLSFERIKDLVARHEIFNHNLALWWCAKWGLFLFERDFTSPGQNPGVGSSRGCNERGDNTGVAFGQNHGAGAHGDTARLWTGAFGSWPVVYGSVGQGAVDKFAHFTLKLVRERALLFEIFAGDDARPEKNYASRFAARCADACAAFGHRGNGTRGGRCLVGLGRLVVDDNDFGLGLGFLRRSAVGGFAGGGRVREFVGACLWERCTGAGCGKKDTEKQGQSQAIQARC